MTWQKAYWKSWGAYCDKTTTTPVQPSINTLYRPKNFICILFLPITYNINNNKSFHTRKSLRKYHRKPVTWRTSKTRSINVETCIQAFSKEGRSDLSNKHCRWSLTIDCCLWKMERTQTQHDKNMCRSSGTLLIPVSYLLVYDWY